MKRKEIGDSSSAEGDAQEEEPATKVPRVVPMEDGGSSEDWAHEDEEDQEVETGAASSGGAPSDGDAVGRRDMSSMQEAKRWWRDTEGFDFENSALEQHLKDGLKLKGDPEGWIGKVVKRRFDDGRVYFGKIVGWFDDTEDDEPLWLCLYPDGDSEDLERRDARRAVRWAEQSELDERVRAARKVDIYALTERQRGELDEAESKRKAGLEKLLARSSTYSRAASDPTETAVRGIQFMFEIGRREKNLQGFGADLIQTLFDVGAVAPDPVRREALQRVEYLSQLWKRRFRTLRDHAGDDPRASELVDVATALYALERVGLEHPLKQEAAQFIARHSPPFRAMDFIGFSPSSPGEGFFSDPASPSKLVMAMNLGYAAGQVGLDVGFKLSDVMRLCTRVRRLVVPDATDPGSYTQRWIDNITLIFNVVHIFSNYGELALRPSLLPDEYKYLRNRANLDLAVRQQDVHIVGELCHCLRVFGVESGDPVLDAGVQFIVKHQVPEDGSWPTRGGSGNDDYTRYHAAMCATMALYDPVFRGFGPGTAELHGVASTWLGSGAKRGVTGKVEGVLKVVELAYTDGSPPVGELQQSAEARLEALLQWKQSVDVRSLDDYERKSGRVSNTGVRRVPAAKVRATKLKSATSKLLADKEDFERILSTHRGRPVEAEGEIDGGSVDLLGLFRRVASAGGARALKDSDAEWERVSRMLRLREGISPRSLREYYKAQLESLEAYIISEYNKTTRASKAPPVRRAGQNAKKKMSRSLSDSDGNSDEASVPSSKDEGDEEQEWNSEEETEAPERRAPPKSPRKQPAGVPAAAASPAMDAEEQDTAASVNDADTHDIDIDDLI